MCCLEIVILHLASAVLLLKTDQTSQNYPHIMYYQHVTVLDCLSLIVFCSKHSVTKFRCFIWVKLNTALCAAMSRSDLGMMT